MCFIIEDVREQLQHCCKGREQLPDESRRKKNSNVALNPGGDCSPAQMKFIAGVLRYISVLERVHASQMDAKRPTKRPPGFPQHRPLFTPPTHTDLWLHGEAFESQADTALLEPVLILHPLFYPMMGLNKCPAPNCTGSVKKKGWTHIRSLYGIFGNVKAIGEQMYCSQHKVFSPTALGFWKGRKPWEMGNFPLFFEQAAMTRELFKLIAEFRPKSSVEAVVEGLNAQETERDFYLLYQQQQQHQTSSPMGDIASFPLVDQSRLKVPSAGLVRHAYEIFGVQRLEESSRYMRSLGGLIVGVDSTMKVANKANVVGRHHSGAIESVNPWGGGLLTGVNEDKELVFWEFLPTNSAVYLQAPLAEYAEHSAALSIDFTRQGEVAVDKCCDFRSDITTVSVALNDALVERKGEKGTPTVYRPVEEQVCRMDEMKERMMRDSVPLEVRTNLAIDNQMNHIRAGCLQHRHPHLISNTSINESWHKRINNTVRGMASSLPTVVFLVGDAVLRSNLKITITNHSQSPDSMSRMFRAATLESHHIFLLDDILRLRHALYGATQPRLPDICPSHVLGVVPSRDPSDQALRNLRRSVQGFAAINRELEEAEAEPQIIDDEDDMEGIKEEESNKRGFNMMFLGTTINGEADQDIDPYVSVAS
ncbi:hypothetical protein L202_07429 [Cryptococcus amylolentus CBS 6039]|uniref:Uncharacterized protein n=1 Tax=Cryptococcus amylolentus CBS 6039 TaxID=1295533 RepID=A0A1E3HC62_9TREE|nr:hypothetical protein L202_07429 [Cryptococcus amylolentus CBS 6039]ODN73923.1 hypothetical protein L202_07429 [Cryptococcus amylolentus CBS 6039]